MSYLPQWRALAGARSLLGDLAKIWKKDHWFYVGRLDDVAVVRGCLGKRVHIFGRGRDWPEALAAARLAVASGKTRRLGEEETGRKMRIGSLQVRAPRGTSEVRSQKSEVGSRKSEVGSRKSEVRPLTSDLRPLTTDL